MRILIHNTDYLVYYGIYKIGKHANKIKIQK